MNDQEYAVFGKGQLDVTGGKFSAANWSDFLTSWKWPTEKCWGIWEYVSSLDINQGELPVPDQYPALERVDIFGESGYLSARRDGDNVHWHFIGLPGTAIEDGRFGAESYWKNHPSNKFRRYAPKTALLWGEKRGDRWYDERVGWANLSYHGVDTQRAMIKYWEFVSAGQVVFVWLTGLDNVKEG